MNKVLTVCLALCLTVVGWCDTWVNKLSNDEPPFRVPNIPVKFEPAEERTITGQVFIRTQGGETFKMSGITVCILPEDSFTAFRKWILIEGKRREFFYRNKGNNLTNAG